jgi:Bacterial Ig-like domain (group 3)
LRVLAPLAAIASVMFVMVVVGASPADAIPTSVVTDVNPNSLGSGTLFGGRVEAFAVDPTNSNIVFAASEFGGLWKSTNKGGSWSHVDAVGLTAMNDVKFAASDSNLVIATGFGDGSSDNRGGGIWRSTDGGTTWGQPPGSNLCAPASGNAYKVAIAPGTPGSLTIFVGTDCGLAESNDSGATWTINSPAGGRFWDVAVQTVSSNLQVDACGDGGYFRSNDGGATWPVQNNTVLASGFIPCSVAIAPNDPNTVFFASPINTVNPGDNINETQLLENDNGGVGAWHNLNVSNDGNGRPPWVVTMPAFDGNSNHFEVLYGTDQIVMHQTCSITTTQRCADGTNASTSSGSGGTASGPWSVYDGSIRAVHNSTDPAGLAIDPSSGCPFLEAGDPGVFKTSNGCTGSPTFTDANTGLHALWIYQLAGTAASGHTDVYYGMQDDGINWSTDDAGSWSGCSCADVFQTFADLTGPPSSVLFNSDNGYTLEKEDFSSSLSFSAPPGSPQAGPAAQFGNQSYAFITSDGAKSPTFTVWVTTNAGGTWTQMGPTLPGPPTGLPNGDQQIVASGPAATPTFYLNLSVAGVPTIYKLSGALNTSATLTAVNSGLNNPGAFNVDPSNPLDLYTVDSSFPSGAVKFSNDGGATWHTDATLGNLVTAGGVYPSVSSDITSFGFDPTNGTVMAGTNFTGIFVSIDSGAHWVLVPGSQQIPRVGSFFFDTRNPGTSYVGSQGRGAWRIVLPSPAPTKLTYDGALSGEYNDPATVSATLVDTSSGNAGVPGKTVTFQIGSSSTDTCSATTNASGKASCSITPTQVPGTYTITASFGGDALYRAATDSSKTFTITRDETAVTYTGALTIDYHDPATASATLTDPDGGAPLTGKTLTFTLGVGDTCSAMTNLFGTASCSITPHQTGTQNLVASFAGDTYYLPSSDTKPFVITPEETTMTYTGPTVILAGASGATLTATLVEDGANDDDGDGGSPGPIPAETVTLSIGSQNCTGTTDPVGNVSCTIPSVSVPLGPETVGANFAGDAAYRPSSDHVTAIVFAYPSRGVFTLGDTSVATAASGTVNWWGNSWWQLNVLGGGPAPASFKGFASEITLPTTSPPAGCGSSWTSTGGNSPLPTTDVPSYMGVVVTSAVSKHGSVISGNTTGIVVVKVDAGYASNPGHPGTGTIVATFC